MISRRWALLAATPLAVAGFTLGTGAHAQSAAGQPVATQVLLCGTWATGTDRFSGTSDIDHPSGSSSSGQIYQYTGQNCDQEEGQQGIGTYTWTVRHSMVHAAEAGSAPEAEMGTEHGTTTLSVDGGASTGQHLFGLYGTSVYQDNDLTNLQSSCNASLGSQNLCFEGVINGYLN